MLSGVVGFFASPVRGRLGRLSAARIARMRGFLPLPILCPAWLKSLTAGRHSLGNGHAAVGLSGCRVRFIPLRTHQAGLTKQAVHPHRIVVTPEGQIKTKRKIGGGVIGATIAGPKPGNFGPIGRVMHSPNQGVVIQGHAPFRPWRARGRWRSCRGEEGPIQPVESGLV